MPNKQKEVLCTVLDAMYKEDLGTEESPIYNNSIFMRLQDTETKSIFTSSLSSDNVKEIVGLSRDLTSREMIHFAQKLRDRESPMRLLIPEDATIVDVDSILASQKLDEEELSVDLDDVEDIAVKIVDKFSVKKKK
jgi:hypothetical protein